MSSDNAQNIYDIQTNARYVRKNDYSDSTPSMGFSLNGSSTYYDNENSYNQYIFDRAENIAIEKQFIQDEGDDMNNNEILRAYMDKVDNDQRDLKGEMRERERRVEQNIKDSEHRMDERLDRIERMIIEQNKNYVNEIDKLASKFDDSVKEIKSDKKQTVAIVIATVLSVAAIAIASIQVVQGFLSLVR